ncbi:MAG TPA: enoyl-CoA hydratase-related protein [Bdellovibrio sp.]|uniref:enoyl-CoA hydratase/isomerase family protein n=1 Tax=Bdellovibrio sp. TaxID=28201 RepID=UPI002F1D7377
MVLTKIENDILWMTLNRPEKSNAYNFEMATQLRDEFQRASANKNLRALVLSGNGKNFCTGADLEWMSHATDLSEKENQADLKVLKELYESALNLDIPIVCLAHGRIYGGGLGLVAVSDIVVCDTSTDFALSEAKIGLVPGIITPLVIHKIGASHFAEASLTARVFSADEALRWGLVHHLVSQQDHSAKANLILREISENSARSLAEIKKTIRDQFFASDILQRMLSSSAKMRHSDDFRQRSSKFKK